MSQTLSPARCLRCGRYLSPTDRRCSYCQAPRPEAHIRPALPTVSPSAPSIPTSPSTTLPPEIASLHPPRPSGPPNVAGALWLALWALVPTISLLWHVAAGYAEMVAYNRLSSEGIVTTATITDLKVRSTDDTSDYYVYYEFQASINGNVTLVRGRDQISETLFRGLGQGQPIEIVYWSADPSLSAVRAQLRPVSLRWISLLGGIGGGLVLLTLGGLLIVFGSLRDWMTLKQRGIPVRGTVFRKWSYTDSDGDSYHYVAYAFTANVSGKGSRLIARTEQNKKLYESVTEGDEVTVLYLPGRPRICQAYPSGSIVSEG